MKSFIKKYLSWIVLLGTIFLLSGCKGGGNIVDELLDQFNHKALTSFSLPSNNGPINGVIAGNNISVVMPYGTSVTSLVASFTTTGETVTISGKPQVSGITVNNFTTPLIYTVTAKDRTTRNYTVTVTVAKADANAITAYSLPSANGPVNGVITGDAISVVMPYGSNISNLIATFTTNGANVKVGTTTEVSGQTVNNFSNPVTYTVYAADGSSQNYVVTVTVAKSSNKAITAYAIEGINGVITNNAISVVMPYGTDVKSLIATFASNGANVKVGTITEVSGHTANDFTHPVIYTVYAADGSSQNYTVTVTLALNPAKAITSYSINNVEGVIGTNSINVELPYGTAVTDLVAKFTTSGASVKVGATTQVSTQTANNFTNPVTYTVIAADGSTQNYTVTVTLALNPAKAITSYSINNVEGVIGTNTINVQLPYGTAVTDLVAKFTSSGASVKVGSTTQISTQTANNFTNPVTYTVTAADGSSQNYTVTVTLALNPAKAITSYSINNVEGVIGTNTINVELPYGTDVTDLVAKFTTSGASVKVGATTQVSMQTVNNFTNPVTYTVTAADGSTQNYTVTVTLALNPAKAITSYSINNVEGVIGTNTINVELPYGTDVKDLVAKFTTSGASVKVGAITQVSTQTANNFTNPVTYTVTAADGTTQNYQVTVGITMSFFIKAEWNGGIYSMSLGGINVPFNCVTVPSNFQKCVATLPPIYLPTSALAVDGYTSARGPMSETCKKNFMVNTILGNVINVDYFDHNICAMDVTTSLFSCVADGSNQCGCLVQNDGSGLIWYADGSQTGTWINWCSHTGPAADINCVSDGSSLVAFNRANHCGYNDWHLPTAPNASNATFVDQMGGNWGSIGTYAKNNGWTERAAFYTWLNTTSGTNHFNNVANNYYWSAACNFDAYPLSVNMNHGSVNYGFQDDYDGILLVRSGQ